MGQISPHGIAQSKKLYYSIMQHVPSVAWTQLLSPPPAAVHTPTMFFVNLSSSNQSWNSNESASPPFAINFTDDFRYESKKRKKRPKCVEWKASEHSFFQFYNACFLLAFALPRQYKTTILLFRILLCVSFILSSIWWVMDPCLTKSFIYSALLASVNAAHTAFLMYRFLPPTFSLEMTELYLKVFKPYKVSKRRFQELLKHAEIVTLDNQNEYAKEGFTPSDKYLSLLIRGKLKVCSRKTFMHQITQYQFVDSVEYLANPSPKETRFQVTITAEGVCTLLKWSRSDLDRIFSRHPEFRCIFEALVGKDVTLKMYYLNEQVHHMNKDLESNQAARVDHWRNLINRSCSVDAVNTANMGQVRSYVWNKIDKYRRSSQYCGESPLFVKSTRGDSSGTCSLSSGETPQSVRRVAPNAFIYDEVKGCSTNHPPHQNRNINSGQSQSGPAPRAVGLSPKRVIKSQFTQTIESEVPQNVKLSPKLSASRLHDNRLTDNVPAPNLSAVKKQDDNKCKSVSLLVTDVRTDVKRPSLKRQREVKFDETQC